MQRIAHLLQFLLELDTAFLISIKLILFHIIDIFGKCSITGRTGKGNFDPVAMILLQRLQAVQRDVIAVDALCDFLRCFPYISCHFRPAGIDHKTAVHIACHIVAIGESPHDIIRQQSSTEAACGETGYQDLIRIIAHMLHSFLECGTIIGIAVVMEHLLASIQRGIGEVSGTAMEVTGGVGNGQHIPVPERIALFLA